MCSLSPFPVVPPGLSAGECGTIWSICRCLAHPTLQLLPYCTSSLPWLTVSSPPTSLNECFFFNSLVVGLPHSLIGTIWIRFSGSSGCFLFLNLLLSFFWLCEEAKCIYLCLHLGLKSKIAQFEEVFLFPSLPPPFTPLKL